MTNFRDKNHSNKFCSALIAYQLVSSRIFVDDILSQDFGKHISYTSCFALKNHCYFLLLMAFIRGTSFPVFPHRHGPAACVRMEIQRTFIAVKPDGVNRGLVGQIITRFEKKGFKLVGLKAVVPSRELAEMHYSSLSEKPFYPALVNFISSGPVCAMVWEGNDAVSTARTMIGKTDPLECDPGTSKCPLRRVMLYHTSSYIRSNAFSTPTVVLKTLCFAS